MIKETISLPGSEMPQKPQSLNTKESQILKLLSALPSLTSFSGNLKCLLLQVLKKALGMTGEMIALL